MAEKVCHAFLQSIRIYQPSVRFDLNERAILLPFLNERPTEPLPKPYAKESLFVIAQNAHVTATAIPWQLHVLD
jgi:hypothetical protein